jgi:hypothetical protein
MAKTERLGRWLSDRLRLPSASEPPQSRRGREQVAKFLVIREAARMALPIATLPPRGPGRRAGINRSEQLNAIDATPLDADL